MKLYLGGISQGKTEYVNETEKAASKIWDDFHLWVRDLVFSGHEEEEIRHILDEELLQHPDMVIVSNEIGNGIVPMDPIERKYRDITGHLLIYIAKKCDEVFRITCQIPVKIK